MKRAAMAIVAATLAAGCAHLRLRDGAGDVDLDRPPPVLAARGATLPRPPVDHALVLTPGLLTGAGAREGDGTLLRQAGLGFELGIALTHVTVGDVVRANGNLDYGFGADRRAWGLNLGVTPSLTRIGYQTHLQPLAYVEGQWRSDLTALAAGVAFTPNDARRARTGVQVTPAYGPAYARVLVLLDGNVAFEVGVTLKFPVVLSWAD